MTYREERTFEQIYRSAVGGLYARLRSNYDFLYRKLGDDGLRLITEMNHEYGLSVAARARKLLKNNDLESVAGYLLRIFNTVDKGEAGQFIERSDARIVIKAYKCPLSLDSVPLCLAHTAMEKTVVEELNPDLVYRVGKSIPAGDSFCEHIIEFKGK